MCEGSWPCCDGCCRDIHQTEDHEPVNEPTCSQRDAASTIFNLPDYRVIEARDRPEGGRRVVVESTYPPGCPDGGVWARRGEGWVPRGGVGSRRAGSLPGGDAWWRARR